MRWVQLVELDHRTDQIHDGSPWRSLLYSWKFMPHCRISTIIKICPTQNCTLKSHSVGRTEGSLTIEYNMEWEIMVTNGGQSNCDYTAMSFKFQGTWRTQGSDPWTENEEGLPTLTCYQRLRLWHSFFKKFSNCETHIQHLTLWIPPWETHTKVIYHNTKGFQNPSQSKPNRNHYIHETQVATQVQDCTNFTDQSFEIFVAMHRRRRRRTCCKRRTLQLKVCFLLSPFCLQSSQVQLLSRPICMDPRYVNVGLKSDTACS